MPLLIDESEWQAITAGLVQRAELFEAIVADIYGENRLVADGLLPPGLIASSPEFLRPMVGVKPASGHFLHFCAFELGRGPNGNWWVLGDRTQAPSGAGFALENRVATTRALSDIYGEMHVHRLAGFFRRFRDALHGMVAAPSGRVAILTPGPLNETYYEHAYIARYLGIMLLEGDDLTVSDGRLMVRTVSGLKPVSVLWRRMDAAFADPLELNPQSHIGTPGLAEALRHGSVSLVNALGSGILETRAFLAFLPELARTLLGEELLLPNIATWWCGQAKERRHVIDNIERMMIGPALSTRLPFEDERATVLGETLDPAERAALVARLDRGRRRFRRPGSGDAVDHAGLCAWQAGAAAGVAARLPGAHRRWLDRHAGRLRPRRARRRHHRARHAARRPGGRRLGGQPVARSPSRRCCPASAKGFTRNVPGSLPSRAAENLVWLGRYVERSEGTARILRAYHARLAETSDPELPLLADMRDYLEPLGIDADAAIPPGLVSTFDRAVSSAGQIRDRFSPDGWLALRDLSKTVHKFATTVAPGDDATRAMTVILRKLAGFSGLLHENMYRFTGWRFLEIGRRLERASTSPACSACWRARRRPTARST